MTAALRDRLDECSRGWGVGGGGHGGPFAPPSPPCELSRVVVLVGETSAQHAAHAVHKRETKACPEPNNGPGRLSQKTSKKHRPSESTPSPPPSLSACAGECGR